MKKIVALLLMLAICLCTPSCISEDNGFTPSVASEMKYQAGEWFAYSNNRALMTVLLALEIASENVAGDSSFLEILFNSSFVGKNNQDLYVLGSTTNNLVFIGYSPAQNRASYDLLDPADTPESAESIITDVLDEVCADGYYKNDVDEIQTILENINLGIANQMSNGNQILDENQSIQENLSFDAKEYYNSDSGLIGITEGTEMQTMIPFGEQLGFYISMDNTSNAITQIFFLANNDSPVASFWINEGATYMLLLHDIDGENSYHTIYKDEQELVHALADAHTIKLILAEDTKPIEYDLTSEEIATINSAFGYLDTHNFLDAVTPEYIETCEANSTVYPLKVS